MVMDRAPAASELVSALMEFRQLNKKCGLIWLRNICSSAACASANDCISRRCAA